MKTIIIEPTMSEDDMRNAFQKMMTESEKRRYTYEYFAYIDESDGKKWRLCKDIFVKGEFKRTISVSHQADKPNVPALNKTLDKLGKRAKIY